MSVLLSPVTVSVLLDPDLVEVEAMLLLSNFNFTLELFANWGCGWLKE